VLLVAACRQRPIHRLCSNITPEKHDVAAFPAPNILIPSPIAGQALQNVYRWLQGKDTARGRIRRISNQLLMIGRRKNWPDNRAAV
jgi:hypothetical protein